LVKTKEDLTNKRFDRLTVIRQSEDYITPGGMRISQWLCRCDCGNEIEDAITTRKEAEEKYFGEFSYDNSMRDLNE
jgi:hypothetical protein